MKEDKHCIIINSGRCLLVVTQLKEKGYSARLPFKNEVKLEIVNSPKKVNVVDPDLLIINTNKEIPPWDLFVDFPPENYSDYGYLDLKNNSGKFSVTTVNEPESKETYEYWGILNDKDKSLIKLYQLSVSLE